MQRKQCLKTSRAGIFHSHALTKSIRTKRRTRTWKLRTQVENSPK
nr:MAG TPA: hypothetical protein [Caudoviricetes sp.]